MPFAPIAKILTTTKSIPKQQQDQKKKQKKTKNTTSDVTQSNQSSETFENASFLPSFSQMCGCMDSNNSD